MIQMMMEMYLLHLMLMLYLILILKSFEAYMACHISGWNMLILDYMIKNLVECMLNV